MAEQVERHDVQSFGGQRPGERLLHPSRHQLPVEQHDPAVAAAVLGELQAVAIDEELTDPLGDQHDREI